MGFSAAAVIDFIGSAFAGEALTAAGTGLAVEGAAGVGAGLAAEGALDVGALSAAGAAGAGTGLALEGGGAGSAGAGLAAEGGFDLSAAGDAAAATSAGGTLAGDATALTGGALAEDATALTGGGFGGGGFDAGAAMLPDAGAVPLGADSVPVLDVAGDGGAGAGFDAGADLTAGDQSLFDKMLGKVNPLTAGALGLNLASAAAQRRAGKGVPQKLGDIAKPFQEQGQALIDQYKRGELNAADEFNINKWEHDQVARVRDFYNRAGMGDSTAALNAVAQVEAQAQAMRDKSLASILDQGMKLMGMAVGPLTTAVQASAQQDEEFVKAQAGALNSWMMLTALTQGRSVPAPVGGA